MPDRPETDGGMVVPDPGNVYVLTPATLGITGVSAIRGALDILIRRRWLVGAVAIGFLIAGVAYVMLATPVYRAEVTLAPVTSDSAASRLGGMVSQLGSIAALAGLPGLTGSSAQEAVAVLKSRSLTAEFIARRKLLPVLFADDWDPHTGRWTVEPKDVPTLVGGVQLFDDRIRSVSTDINTGIVTLTVEWSDPAVAAEWANALVQQVNRTLRERQIKEATKSLDYLRQQIQRSDVVEIRDSLFNLVEEQEKRRMFASVNEQFAFKILDPAMAPDPDDLIRPRAPVVLLIAVLLGLIFGWGAAMLADLSASRKRERSHAE